MTIFIICLRNPEEYKDFNNKVIKMEKEEIQTKNNYTDHKKLNLSSTSMDSIIIQTSTVKRKKKSSILKNL